MQHISWYKIKDDDDKKDHQIVWAVSSATSWLLLWPLPVMKVHIMVSVAAVSFLWVVCKPSSLPVMSSNQQQPLSPPVIDHVWLVLLLSECHDVSLTVLPVVLPPMLPLLSQWLRTGNTRERQNWLSIHVSAVEEFGSILELESKRDLRKSVPPSTSNFECQIWHRMCRLRIGLLAHNKSHLWWWDRCSVHEVTTSGKMPKMPMVASACWITSSPQGNHMEALAWTSTRCSIITGPQAFSGIT